MLGTFLMTKPPVMPISTKALRAHIKIRELISLRRAAIDGNSIQGFVLDCSETLLLLQYVYDFRLDGFMVLRREDITALKADDTNRFQQQLLVAEGVFAEVDFAFRAPIQSFDGFLASRPPEEIVIVEDENADPDIFLIGAVAHVGNGTAAIRHFTGVARLLEEPEEISTARITSCQTDTNYIRFYQRYFERNLQRNNTR